MKSFLLLSILAIFISSCTRTASTSHHGNATGFGGVINLENARVRCDYREEEKGRTFDVRCRALVITPEGNEILAAAIAPGISLDWKEPFKIEGGDFSIQDFSVAPDKLSQTSRIVLAAPVATKLQFDLVAKEASSEKQNTESDTVLLPFSAESFGMVPELLKYLSAETQDVQRQAVQTQNVHAGLQSDWMPAKELIFDAATSICTRGEDIFFSTSNQIFQLKGDKVRLYAGSSNPGNREEYSHRLRVQLNQRENYYEPRAPHLLLTCGKDALYALPRKPNRKIFKILDSGPVIVIDRQLSNPVAMKAADDGSLYVLNGNQLLRLLPSGEWIVVAGTEYPSGGFAGDGGPAKNALFTLPNDLAFGADGSLFIADYGNHRIRRIDPQGIIQTVISSAEIFPEAVALSPQGEVHLSSQSRILKVDGTGALQVLAGQYSVAGYDGDGVPAVNAKLSYIYGMTFLKDGSLLLADSSADFHGIRRIDTAGIITTVAGSVGQAIQLRRYTATDAQFGAIRGLAITPDDSIYFIDYALTGRRQYSFYLRKIDPEGGVTLVMNLTAGQPRDLVADNSGNLYISESPMWRIRKVQLLPTPTSSIIAYMPNIYPESLAFGTAGEILFTNNTKPLTGEIPYSLGMLKNGTVTPYSIPMGGIPAALSDQEILLALPDRVLRYNLLTKESTRIAGGEQAGYSGDGGPALNAKLNGVTDMVMDGDQVFLTDRENGRIRILTPDPEAPGTYRIDSLFGGTPQKDCSGTIERKLTAENLENDVKLSLSTLCFGRPTNIAVRNHCEPGGKGHITYAVAQAFGERSNIVRIRRPCPQP